MENKITVTFKPVSEKRKQVKIEATDILGLEWEMRMMANRGLDWLDYHVDSIVVLAHTNKARQNTAAFLKTDVTNAYELFDKLGRMERFASWNRIMDHVIEFAIEAGKGEAMLKAKWVMPIDPRRQKVVPQHDIMPAGAESYALGWFELEDEKDG